jgi:histidyl-tRNA synthetase
MYSFEDALNGEHLTLRPEGTASCVRAAIQHNLLFGNPRRLYYQGPMFRHERPRRPLSPVPPGRRRGPRFRRARHRRRAHPDVRPPVGRPRPRGRQARDQLAGQQRGARRPPGRADHLPRAHKDSLDEDGQRRLYTNPLRILDTKNPDLQAIVEAAPKLADFLGEESLKHFDGVQTILKDAGLPYRINHRLVRGLDYYNRTVFEWVTTRLGAQGTICAGGRYDGLVAQLGGKPAPAAGFAMGVERLLALWQESGGQAERVVPDDTWCTPARPPSGPLSASPKACAARALRSRCTVVAAASSRR